MQKGKVIYDDRIECTGYDAKKERKKVSIINRNPDDLRSSERVVPRREPTICAVRRVKRVETNERRTHFTRDLDRALRHVFSLLSRIDSTKLSINCVTSWNGGQFVSRGIYWIIEALSLFAAINDRRKSNDQQGKNEVNPGPSSSPKRKRPPLNFEALRRVNYEEGTRGKKELTQSV